MNQQEKIKLLAEKVMGWYYLDLDYFGTGEESQDMIKHSDCFNELGIEHVGKY